MRFLSTIGLVYLMFSAGLEVDINQFMKVRARAVVFGMGLGYILGLDWLGTILLGSAFALHTLLAFPILAKLGVTRNEAKGVTIGATDLTDIGAFIVLAVVLGAKSGGGIDIWYFIQLLAMLIVFTAAIIFGLRKRVSDMLGNTPEQLAKSFEGNLAILHFAKLLEFRVQRTLTRSGTS
ncbi:MAG TPA: cation:proton antiporter [Anaerolineales bacterium]|nr:cation:proton antiporter [Anaerolineales bacterium]